MRIYKDIFVQKSWYISLVQKWEMKYLSCPKEIWCGIRQPGESVWANSIWKLDFRALGSTLGSFVKSYLYFSLACLFGAGGGIIATQVPLKMQISVTNSKSPRLLFTNIAGDKKPELCPTWRVSRHIFLLWQVKWQGLRWLVSGVWWLVVYKPCCGCFFTHSVVDVVQSKINFS